MSLISAYVSGYTNQESVGIYQYEFNPATGALTPKGLAVESVNPSFITIHEGRKYMYAVNEVGEYKGKKTGYVSAYTRDKETGQLTLVNEQPSGGEDPCHAICDKTGSFLFVANYTGGSASVFPIASPDSTDFSLREISSNPIHSEKYQHTLGNPERQEKPHVHSVDLDPVAQQYLFANDLGCDLLVTYKFDRQNNGIIVPHSTFEFPSGSGPRHLKFAPNNNGFCYVITELSNDIFMLQFNFHEGKFNQVQKIHALPEGAEAGTIGAEIDISPNGRFLYASFRGEDIITIFEIDEKTGKLTLVGYQPTGGKHPRFFTIDPTGQYLLVANKDSDNIITFKMDDKSGLLTQVSSVDHIQPTCLQFWL